MTLSTTSTDPMTKDRLALLARGRELAQEGHAVTTEVVHDAEGKVVSVQLYHYRTCVVCAREKRKPE